VAAPIATPIESRPKGRANRVPDPNGSQLRRSIEAHPVRVLWVALAVTFGALSLLSWEIWDRNQRVGALYEREFRQQGEQTSTSRPDSELAADTAFARELALARQHLDVANALAIATLAGLLMAWIALVLALRGRLRRGTAETGDRNALDVQLQYAQRLESLGVLAGGIAHDFNNLLTGILSNAGTARRKLAASDDVQRHLSEIVQGSKVAAHLTAQILAFAGKGKFQVQARDLTAEVLEIQDLLETSARTKATLYFKLAEGLPAIMADPTQIQQVLINLVVNASESREGDVDVTIETHSLDLRAEDIRELAPGSSLAPGRCVALDVSDTGWGIAPETLRHIFDPFFTTKSGGRGLGLAATLGIAHRHGGGIRARSKLGEGTSFRVLFPASDEAVRPTPQPMKTDLSGHGVVMIVDDDDYILQAVYVALESYGYSVLLADGGPAAIALFEEQSDEIDLVLLDMLMPGMSGEETFRALRAIRPDVKVLLSTGYAPDEAAQKFTEDGLAGFLRKPYDPDELAREVQRIIERGDDQPSARMHEALRELRIRYRDRLPEQVAELAETLQLARGPGGRDAVQKAREIAHRLAGSAGSYGFSEVHALLDRIDSALNELLRDSGDWSSIDGALAQLREQLERSDPIAP
jgi:signal transduction histidine kinase/CheY-like chemotaxis protein